MDYPSYMGADGPFIMVHKNWTLLKKEQLRSSSSPSVSDNEAMPSSAPSSLSENAGAPNGRRFQFINTTKPNQTREVAVRSRVRSHARNQRSSFIPIDKTLSGSHATRLCTSKYPIDMQPHTHELLTKYLTFGPARVFALEKYLESNPLRTPEWFKLAITDAAMLHSMLYAAAVYMALLEGKTESRDIVYHESQTISILQKRLAKSNGLVEDSTLGAISCLALGEAIMGRGEIWHAHIKALKHMIAAKGSFSSLSPLMQAKLRRSDITGAIDYAAIPCLDILHSDIPPSWSILPSHKKRSTELAMTDLLLRCQISPALASIMVELSLFSQTIQFAKSTPGTKLDPVAFSEDLYDIEYKLLAFPTMLAASTVERPVDKACRLGSLLYIKSTLEEFPNSIIGPSVLLGKLRESLSEVDVLEGGTSLLVWLAMIGAMLEKAETKTWFVEFTVGVMAVTNILSFEVEILALNALLNLESVFGKQVQKFWEEVNSMKGSILDEIASMNPPESYVFA